ncbi:MAG: hypothetical protein AAF532_02620 [Planctomycetota bacterium]
MLNRYTSAVVVFSNLLASACFAADVDWIDFTGIDGSQLPQSFSSPDGLSATVKITNVGTLSGGTPSSSLHIIEDPGWTFSTNQIPQIRLHAFSFVRRDFDGFIEFVFDSPGYLPSGGVLAFVDVESENTSFAITAYSNGAPVDVDWDFQTFDLVEGVTHPPIFDHDTATLSGDPDPPFHGESLALLIADVPVERIVIESQIAYRDGVHVGVGAIAVVPEPHSAALITLTVVGLVVSRLRRCA